VAMALALAAFVLMIGLPIYLLWSPPTRHDRGGHNVVKDMGGLGGDSVPDMGSHHAASHSDGGHGGGDGGGGDGGGSSH
jgi:hypothetical protein